MLDSSGSARAAQSTTGTVVGRVVTANGPLANADIDAASTSGRYHARSGSDGTFALVGVAPDTYTVSVEATGYDARTFDGVVVLPGGRLSLDVRLVRALKEIGHVEAHGLQGGAGFGETQDVFRVVGANARGLPSASSSGLGSYTQGTVQGAVAAVPGVQQDQFANVVLQGGKIEDTVFSYDDVPVPQGLIAEPGGNIVGAQLPTTGLGYTTVTTGGLSDSSDQGLAGVIDEIPATGVYPAQTTLTLGQALLPGARQAEIQRRWATPDLRQRYAFDAEFGSKQLQYGDGTTFYPSEAGTYGIALDNRATWSLAANAHFRIGRRDDVSFSTLEGQAVYDQYGTPYAGETSCGTFNASTDCTGTLFPGATSGTAQVDTPTRIRGTYGVQKLADLRSYDHSTARLQLYASEYGSHTQGPFFDDLSFRTGAISYYGGQSAALYGLSLDVQNIASAHNEIGYGAEVRTQISRLDQLVPSEGNHITSFPVLNSYLGYLSDRWTPASRFSLTATARVNGTWVVRSDGNRYGVSAIDPHLGLNYTVFPNVAFLATYDHTTQAPNPLEVERNGTQNAAPFVPVAPEVGDSYELGLATQGRVGVRLTYFAKSEHNLIDTLPVNLRSAVASSNNPTAFGVPTNAGNLLAHGYELSTQAGPFSLSATYIHGFSSSASQFAYNDLNAPALAAGHLFPLGYVPDFSATMSYELHVARGVTVTPSLSYESGYPYGNGKTIWVFDSVTNKPEQVPNDNYVNDNPGFNYYFLKNPAVPFNPATNPYIGSLGTPEGNDPNTLRSAPQILASLHVRAALSSRATLLFDVVNLFGNANPTQVQSNPYLIGPPGYAGGNPAYESAYGQLLCPSGSSGCTTQPYTLGNGVPTNDGRHQALPWTYGTAGYVPASYPNARAVFFRLQYRL